MGKSFKGGVLLRGKPAAELSTEPLNPERVTLPIKEGYTVTVNRGARIKRGDILALPSDIDSCALPSSIGGIVSEITDSHIIIDSDADMTISDHCAPLIGSILDFTPEQLRGVLLPKGIRLPDMPKRKIKCFVINCVENDSYVSSRARLLLEHPDKVMGGAKIIMRIFGVRHGICAVPSSMLECANALEHYCPRNMLKIRQVGNKFPQHNPNILVSTLFNVEINSTIDPTSIGYLVFTPEICAAVFSALAEGEPYTQRTVTVTGDCTGYTCNVSVPFGTQIGEVLDRCGGLISKPAVILRGGEMSGKALSLTDTVDAYTDAITALSESELPKSAEALPCIGCGSCANACPIRLMPSLINKYAEKGMVQTCLDLDIECCIGCGCCTASCPSGIDLAEKISAAHKSILGILKKEQSLPEQPLVDNHFDDKSEFVLMTSKQLQMAEQAAISGGETAEPATEAKEVTDDGLERAVEIVDAEAQSTEEPTETSNVVKKDRSDANRLIFGSEDNTHLEMPTEIANTSDESQIYDTVLFDEQLRHPEVSPNPDEAELRISVLSQRTPTKRLSAALRSTETPATMTLDLMIAMLPLLAWSVYLFGVRPIIISLFSILSCLTIDILIQLAINREVRFRDLLPMAIGMAVSLGLPPTAPLWLPIAAGGLAAVLRTVSKVTAIFNIDPTVLSLTVFSVTLPKIMTHLCGVGSQLGAMSFNAGGFIAPAGENALQELTSGVLPQTSLGTMFVGMRSGLIGEMSALILIIVGIYLICRKIIKPGLPIAFILTVFVISYFTPQVEIVSDMIALEYSMYQILAGDTLLGAIVLASSPYIKPISHRAGLASGVIGGALTVLIRLVLEPRLSVLIALLVMSILARPLDRLLRPAVFGGKLRKKK